MIILLVVFLVFVFLRFAGLFMVLAAQLFAWSLVNPGRFLLLFGTLVIICGHSWGLLAIVGGFFLWRRRP